MGLLDQVAGALANGQSAQGNPLLDVELPNLIVTPHAAWLSEQALAKLAQQLVDNIAAFLQGEPRNLVE